MDPFIPSLQGSVARFSTALRTGPLDAPVRGCPGWDLAELTRHLGFIHRWARLAAETAGPPDASRIDAAPADPAGLADWFDRGADALIGTFAALDPDGPTWHPFPVPLVGRVWPRRQAHEAFVHAWDAEDAIGTVGPMDPWTAADGVAEYFEVIVGRIIQRDARPAPVGTLAIECTDTAFHHGSNRLVVRADSPLDVVVDPTAVPDAVMSGTAEELSLALWGRRPLATADTHPLVAAWLAYGGN
ncbi:MAG: maleylpyruvate isomerase family mycothiol-dependent enzyme [Actinobacteria bacterium]|nr:maleylpyruvate isomerase family mycothiol-dependent enzyme [Actinomycetota bacterium]